jgi:uncharacterized protein YndB with AHSA1/START domain
MATIAPQTIDFADTAPVWVEGTAVAEATPEQVWQVLVDYPSWPSWFGGGVTSVKATSDPATGVGSTREVLLGKGKPLRFHERFIAWDEGKRWSFTAIEGPGVIAGLVERCLIEPISPTRTRVTYRMAFAPKAALKPFVPVLKPGIRRALTKGMEGLAAEAQARSRT